VITKLSSGNALPAATIIGKEWELNNLCKWG
jgi:hypothetical protein